MTPGPHIREIPDARWWSQRDATHLECQLCPHHCVLAEGQTGFCRTRSCHEMRMQLKDYGRCSGLWVDPIEKKPLFHFLPGTRALSFGTAGCNLACRFCQNWELSQARTGESLPADASPDHIADQALRHACRSVAFTYNDPVVFAEQALATAKACHERGLRTVAVSAGYVSKQARQELFASMDAANVDLKSFSDDFYRRLCRATLPPVLETLEYLHRETQVWLEVTTLLIPGENDSDDELERVSDWFAGHLGPEVPWHFSAFHPAHRMTELPPTPPETLARARRIALAKGIHFVYTGNVHDRRGASTWCPSCGSMLIERDWFELRDYHLNAGRCPACHRDIPGRFECHELARFPRSAVALPSNPPHGAPASQHHTP